MNVLKEQTTVNTHALTQMVDIPAAARLVIVWMLVDTTAQVIIYEYTTCFRLLFCNCFFMQILTSVILTMVVVITPVLTLLEALNAHAMKDTH